MYLISSLSHHLLSTIVPDCRNSHHPVELDLAHVKATRAETFIKLVPEVVEDNGHYIHQVVLLIAVDGTDGRGPAHIL